MRRILLVFAMALMPLATLAQNWERARAAYEAGDYAAAVDEFRLLAERGDAAAQNNLGAMNYYGLGQPVDLEEAARWFRMASDQGDPDGQNNLGAMYDTGLGVAKNHARAVQLYRLAAGHGHAGGQFNLGLMYSRGEGVTRDYVSAHMWFSVAGANGMVLGREYRDGIAKLMTSDHVSDAERRAAVCLQSAYGDCD